jgi:hypothetical protein
MKGFSRAESNRQPLKPDCINKKSDGCIDTHHKGRKKWSRPFDRDQIRPTATAVDRLLLRPLPRVGAGQVFLCSPASHRLRRGAFLFVCGLGFGLLQMPKPAHPGLNGLGSSGGGSTA